MDVPNAARSGQTKNVVVGVTDSLCPETVEVDLFKGLAGGGYQFIGSLTQFVPVRSANRTTDFNFSYTFTPQDKAAGKTTFLAFATIIGASDAFPADNTATANTKVS